MPPLTPRPIPLDIPLAALAGAAPGDAKAPAAVAAGQPGRYLGVWLGAARPLRGALVLARRVQPVLIDRDLGRLLRRCPAVAVFLDDRIAVVPAALLAGVRTLRIAAQVPDMLAMHAIRLLLPDLRGGACGVDVPLERRSAEEALAALASVRAPVRGSRVVYRALSDIGTDGAADD